MTLLSFLNTKSSGKTTLLANLAVVLAKRSSNTNVILLDLNLLTPDMAYLFNLIDESKREYPPFLDDLYRYIRTGEHVDLKSFLTPIKHVPNLSVLCGTRDLNEDFMRLTEHQWHFFFNLLRPLNAIVLVDTGHYQNNSLYHYLVKSSDSLVLVQDQDLFGTAHTAFIIPQILQFVSREKLALWISRYEPESPVSVSYVEELLGLTANYRIPGMPRRLYIQSILKEEPFGYHNIQGYTELLESIASSILGEPVEDNKGEKQRWKLLSLKKKSIAT